MQEKKKKQIQILCAIVHQEPRVLDKTLIETPVLILTGAHFEYKDEKNISIDFSFTHKVAFFGSGVTIVITS